MKDCLKIIIKATYLFQRTQHINDSKYLATVDFHKLSHKNCLQITNFINTIETVMINRMLDKAVDKISLGLERAVIGWHRISRYSIYIIDLKKMPV